MHADLEPLARKYIWWKTPEEALQFPRQVIARIMDTGTLEDIHTLTLLVGNDALRETLRQAEAGQFRPRSWHYWHYRLRLAQPGQVPPLPWRARR